jgi:hypothetical protein
MYHFPHWGRLPPGIRACEATVSHREHRFELGQKLGTKCLFDNIPLIGRIIMGWGPEPFVM